MTLIEAVKDSPPVAVATASLAGLPIQTWVLVLTGVYTIMLIIDKIPKVAAVLANAWHKAKEIYDGRKGD